MNDIDQALELNHQPLSGCLDSERAAYLTASHPHLFADSRVHLARSHRDTMAHAIEAMERVVALPGWQARTLSDAPETARHPSALKSVFFGYDFHITEAGPKLIEINTNAGGAFINACLLRFQQGSAELPDAEALELEFVEMFRKEWALGGADRPLARVAIVDEHPEQQYLYPDFECCRQLLIRSGIDAVICDPAELRYESGCLLYQGLPVDLIYNRLTDFSLAGPGLAALRQTWLDGTVQVTPHPRAHALYADKQNLVFLSDGDWLASIGVSAEDRAVIAAILPSTELVHADQGDDLWARRKHLFFKPLTGYGGKAVYRGSNVTKRVFGEILAGHYVAQTLAPPPSRTVVVEGAEGEVVELKYDLRCYAYDGKIQLLAARLWQGQTTNFRTPGGGFAPVVLV
ncbi:MAG TPA: hypothetical protein VFW68_13110 [Rhodocyclaceae bacterium]|nr:hypothetical protein [Rhodocyclaceae bacterium]